MILDDVDGIQGKLSERARATVMEVLTLFG